MVTLNEAVAAIEALENPGQIVDAAEDVAWRQVRAGSVDDAMATLAIARDTIDANPIPPPLKALTLMQLAGAVCGA